VRASTKNVRVLFTNKDTLPKAREEGGASEPPHPAANHNNVKLLFILESFLILGPAKPSMKLDPWRRYTRIVGLWQSAYPQYQ